MNKNYLIFGIVLLLSISFTLSATGGIITTSGLYTIHTFLVNDTFITTEPISNAEVLIVAEGGCGNGRRGGGGGAGGVVYNISNNISSGTYSVIVGNHSGCPYLDNAGYNSSFNGMLAFGGGAGEGESGGRYYGGSGGGGQANSNLGGNGTIGQGHNGGAGGYDIPYAAGGGGGCGTIGTDGAGDQGGAGGTGCQYNISGTPTYYGGGGGGGVYNYGTGGAGSLGGGGAGGGDNNGGNGINGIDGLGGGGGGAQYISRPYGEGGSGIVIIRYLTTVPPVYQNQTFNNKTTTDLATVTNITNVENFTVASTNSSVQWANPVDLSGVSTLSQVVLTSSTFISVNVNATPSLNTPAEVSLTPINNNCGDFILYYANGFYSNNNEIVNNGQKMATSSNVGGDCNDPTVCTNVQCTNSILTFNAKHFDGFGLKITPEIVKSCQSTRGSIFAAFSLIALFIIVGAAFLIINMTKGEFDSTSIIVAIVGFIAVAIVIFVGYLVISQVSASICLV